MTLNPLRTLFLMLSRTPPAIMLLMIIGVAVLVTVTVTSSESVRDKAFNDTLKDLERKNNAKTKVVYVIKDIADGQVITSEALEEKEIELARTPQDAVTNSTIAIGRTVKYGVSTGQILSTHDLAPQGISLSFESHVKEGMRAVTFAVDANSGVAGFIAPDSHVDILGMAGSGADTKVAPILSDVQVVAVGQMFERQAKNQANPAGSVTVAVSPEDTQKLIKALSASKLYLSLRNGRDHTPVATVDVTALYPRPAKAISATNSGEQALSNLIPPPLPDFNAGPLASASFNSSSAQPVPPPLHEIEMWTGSKKDVVSVPK